MAPQSSSRTSSASLVPFFLPLNQVAEAAAEILRSSVHPSQGLQAKSLRTLFQWQALDNNDLLLASNLKL